MHSMIFMWLTFLDFLIWWWHQHFFYLTCFECYFPISSCFLDTFLQIYCLSMSLLIIYFNNFILPFIFILKYLFLHYLSSLFSAFWQGLKTFWLVYLYLIVNNLQLFHLKFYLGIYYNILNNFAIHFFLSPASLSNATSIRIWEFQEL